MKKHFEITIGQSTFTYARKAEQIAAEAALDGFYILRTSLARDLLQTDGVVRAYKTLSRQSERSGRSRGPTCGSDRSITASRTGSRRTS